MTDNSCRMENPLLSLPTHRFIHFPTLDAWRGVAILWVIVHHVNIFLPLQLGQLTHIFKHFSAVGFLGVDIFFVLSGFLISGLLLSEIDTGIRLKRFYVRRILKIIPQYFAVTVLGIFISYKLLSMGITNIRSFNPTANPLSYMLFLQNYSVQVPTIAHLWSLAIEEHFYLFYPLLFFAVGKYYNKIELCQPQKKNCAINCLICISILLILLIIFLRIIKIDHTILNVYYNQRTHVRVDALIFGGLLRTAEPYFRTFLKLKVVQSLLFIVGLLVFLNFGVNGFNVLNWFHYTLAYLGAGCFILATYSGQYKLGVLVQKVPGLQAVGKCSYGIYLWHYPLIFCFTLIPPIAPNLLIVLVYCLCAILVGWFSTVTLERYFLSMRARFAA